MPIVEEEDIEVTTSAPEVTEEKKLAKKAKKKKPVEREVVHEKVTTKICAGDNALTVTQANKLLGSREAQDGEEYLFTLPDGKKIACDNNTSNRAFVLSNCLALKQEILRNHWEINGESIIIGKTGLILNGQHRLVALILAEADYTAAEGEGFEIDKVPTLDTLLAFGVSEEDAVVNTIDTGKTRSLADALYRSPFFSGMNCKERKVASSVAEAAVKVCWRRTAAAGSQEIKQTHSESLDFLDRHLKLTRAVQHIVEENGDKGQIAKYLRPGQASALLYLMGTSATDPEKYRAAEHPSEKQLDFDLWDKAEDFWVKLAAGDKAFAAVRESLKDMIESGDDSVEERQAMLIKAWGRYSLDESITPKSISLSYTEEENEDGTILRLLNESPTLGGIDLGNKPNLEEVDLEIEVAKASKPKKTSGKESLPAEVEYKCRGVDKDGNEFFGQLLRIDGKKALVKIHPGYKGAGMTRTVPYNSLELAD